jgi:hypothetical protein
MKRKFVCKMIAPLAMASMLMAALGGCTKNAEPAGNDKPVVTIDPVATDDPVVNVDDTVVDESVRESETGVTPETEAETTPEAAPEEEPAGKTGLKDGERYETVIMLEGMEEPVKYEHVINETIGMEMDYDYESLVRQKDGDRERFVSIYDNIDAPENYLEVLHSNQDAETAAAAISAELSKTYDIGKSVYKLDNAGDCIRLDASANVGGKTMPDQLQMVYIIPAGDGSIIATAHYAIEAAEGFGHRFAYLMHTMVVR